MSGDELVTVAEVAAVVKVSQQTARNWNGEGTLPAIRIGRRVRIRRSDSEALLERGAPYGRLNRTVSSQSVLEGELRQTPTVDPGERE